MTWYLNFIFLAFINLRFLKKMILKSYPDLVILLLLLATVFTAFHPFSVLSLDTTFPTLNETDLPTDCRVPIAGDPRKNLSACWTAAWSTTRNSIVNETIHVGFSSEVRYKFKAGPSCTHNTTTFRWSTNVYVLSSVCTCCDVCWCVYFL